jgi:hypothetical protein
MPTVKREFIMPDGSIKAEAELTEEELDRFAQKIMDVLLVPLAYEAVIRDLQQEESGLAT